MNTRFYAKSLHVSLSLLIIISFIVEIKTSAQASFPRLTPAEQANILLERMTPEERVGQLFLITLQGTEVSPESEIYQLITQHHIGGVVLSAENDNFFYDGKNPESTINQTAYLNRTLQQNEWSASLNRQTLPDGSGDFLPTFVPLFIAISQEGDGFPYDQILQGVTILPSAMAIGATWDANLAQGIGEIAGRELSTLGFNLLLGPSLDVLELPLPESTQTLGTRTFGGDPYWVSRMGRAFIRGVHLGSQGKMAVSAKHFPGHGSSDRLPEEEVATIRKSLSDLKSFDLAPFFAVTGLATSAEETADALLTSHIRYQGLQGNIRATTRPLNLDPQAFDLLMQLPELKSWRENGGLMISDDLGSRAMRRFYELTNQTFEARRVALSAFLAGNDMLFISNFTSVADPDAFKSTVHTLEFFAQKYREDPAFAQRVDISVLRILALKYKLYGLFNLGTVLQPFAELENQDKAHQKVLEVARASATLVSPTQAQLDEALPEPPSAQDRLIFISDVRTAQQCSICPEQKIITKNSFRDTILRLYGPQVGGEINPNFLYTYTLEELLDFLNNPDTATISPIETDLRRANWIVFLLLDQSAQYPSYSTLIRFLDEKPTLFQQKKLIVYALGAPFYLDATTISKLTAYYVLYSKTSEFLDVSAYLLFKELRPTGALPVSVPTIGYDLNEMLFPDAEQTISLYLDLPEQTSETPTSGTPLATPTVQFHLQDTLPLRTGIILDYNGHPVPDGTPVRFIFNVKGLPNSIVQETTTIEGVARTTFTILYPGALEIYVQSENARSASLLLDILPSGEPLLTATNTPTPTNTETPTPTMTPTEAAPAVEEPIPQNHPGMLDWLLALASSGVISFGVYRVSAKGRDREWGVRASMLSFIGGMAAYLYLILGLPGVQGAFEKSAPLSVLLGSLCGGLLGIAITFWWKRVYNQTFARKPPSGS